MLQCFTICAGAVQKPHTQKKSTKMDFLADKYTVEGKWHWTGCSGCRKRFGMNLWYTNTIMTAHWHRGGRRHTCSLSPSFSLTHTRTPWMISPQTPCPPQLNTCHLYAAPPARWQNGIRKHSSPDHIPCSAPCYSQTGVPARTHSLTHTRTKTRTRTHT